MSTTTKNRKGKTSKTSLMSIAAFNPPAAQQAETNEQRRQKGRMHTSAVLVYWLSRNDWSHPNVELLAKWALNEESALHPSQLSHLRNGKTRLMGVKCLDALGQVNLAVWAYQNNNKELLDILGAGPLSPQIEGLVKHAEVLMNPNTGLPIDQADWMSVYLGYMVLPDVVNGPEGDPQFQEVVDRFGLYISAVLEAKGIGIADATGMLAKATNNPQLAETLMLAAVGLKPLEANQLTTQFQSICQALTVLDGKKRDPMSVVAEIRSQLETVHAAQVE